MIVATDKNVTERSNPKKVQRGKIMPMEETVPAGNDRWPFDTHA
jgi:hypothetical protein